MNFSKMIFPFPNFIPLFWLYTLVLTTSSFFSLADDTLLAEPWLASRFAQNCAGCHAPGRINRKLADRRCSLSCQGCHINPNGGGLRSHYGKWTSQRWLRSFRSDLIQDSKAPAPKSKQFYGRKKKRKRSNAVKAVPLIEVETTLPPERFYDRRSTPYHKTARSEGELLSYVPAKDPLRLKRIERVTGGFDIRLQSNKQIEPDSTDAQNFLMAADFGVDVRPVTDNVHLVYEGRFSGLPTAPALIKQIPQFRARSFYLLVDDLPYNSFIMTGFYMPLVANDSPDHTRISRRMLTAALTGSPAAPYSLLYQATTVGLAPNVPYLNVHKIESRVSGSDTSDKGSGYAANIGLRFVSFGGSANYTIWQTTDTETEPRDTNITIHAAYLAMTLLQNRATFGLEGMLFEISRTAAAYRARVLSMDVRYRFWGENYFIFEYASSNSRLDLEPGSVTQIRFGLDSFLLPGVAFHSGFSQEQIQEDGARKTERSYVTAQLHLHY